ncbi:TetR/AcrR family transcriptional regulator [Gordonia sp. (in: high G+C Gram-positive bacteria)]|uniref:TetR/AcrR family transcriptional regulator n=1 Tax=Gordonia sp. (in: high G+C Gram-positive bacteria) TaxID=84139 RepID=UPI003C78E411
MTTSKRTRPQRGTDRRLQLIDAATVLFAERGYPYVSVADIARKAGVSTPTLYRHFADKGSLLLAAVQKTVDDLEASTDAAALESSANPAEALAVSITRLSISSPHATSLWRWSGQHLSADDNAEVVRRTRSVLRQWASAIRANRTDLTERESMYLAGAALSVVGSGAGRVVRQNPRNAEATLVELVRRSITLSPDQATVPSPIHHLDDEEPTRRDEILDAAARLFADHGFAGTGMDEIGAAVGITGPSVYKHFASKIAILIGISQRSALRLEAGALAAYAATADPSRRLDALVDHYVDTVTSSPDLLVGFNSAFALVAEPQAAELLAAQRRYVARWITLLTEVNTAASAAGATNTGSRESAVLAVHAALAIVNDAVRLPRSTPRPEFAARMAYLMKGVMGV